MNEIIGYMPRLLLVEDDFDEQHLVMRVVKEFDPNIILDAAHTGKEALVYLDSVPRHELPKLVLLDLDLPIVPGIEVLKRIRARSETKGVPVTVFTGSNRVEDRAACEANHASFVRKPTVHEDYVEALRSILHYWMRLNLTTFESLESD